MYNYLTKLRKSLEAGTKPYGAILELGHLHILDAVCGSGMEFIILDNDKGIFDDNTLQQKTKNKLVDYRMPAMVRTRDASLEAVAKVKDLHTAGLIVPRVTELEQVTAIINEYKAYPMGLRYQEIVLQDPLALQAMERWNEQFLLFIECDSSFLYEQLETITAWEGIDGIYVDPNTLYESMKPMGTTGLHDALERLKALCRDRGKFCMIQENRDGSSMAIRLVYEQYDAVVSGSDFQLLRDSYLSLSSAIHKIMLGKDD